MIGSRKGISNKEFIYILKYFHFEKEAYCHIQRMHAPTGSKLGLMNVWHCWKGMGSFVVVINCGVWCVFWAATNDLTLCG